jgi:hypothetical protein
LGLNELNERAYTHILLIVVSYSVYRIQSADVRLLVLDVSQFGDYSNASGLLKDLRPMLTPDTYIMFNMADRLLPSSGGSFSAPLSISSGADMDRLKKIVGLPHTEGAWLTSVRTGEGMPEFLQGLSVALQQR